MSAHPRLSINQATIKHASRREAIDATVRQGVESIGLWREPVAEIGRARANVIRSLPGDFETGGALLSALERSANLGRPDDYLQTLPRQLAAISDRAVAEAPLPTADQLVWVVVGDKASVLPQLKALGMPVEVRAAE